VIYEVPADLQIAAEFESVVPTDSNSRAESHHTETPTTSSIAASASFALEPQSKEGSLSTSLNLYQTPAMSKRSIVPQVLARSQLLSGSSSPTPSVEKPIFIQVQN
jgi:hypothetical protein